MNQGNITPTSKKRDSHDEVRKDFKGLLGSMTRFLSELLDIRTDTDQETTKESIIADIPFKGHTSWILICSIFIASVGLNANSTAVVIGAMLISPLMGPILGMGLSLAINDIDTLRRSVKNFGVMVVLSVITAFLFFWLFPLQSESSELLARTAPDIRDVLIAFFGGLALVIARAKKGTIASVIFGVAIATALMPPLCTVGFGLAIGNLSYAGGAMYLFIINTIFIGLATFLVIKFLRFPMVRYVNSKRRRMIARIASVVAILVMVPAMFTFYNVFQESIYTRQANDFINKNIGTYKLAGDTRFLNNFTHVDFDKGVNPSIELVFMGNESIPDNVIDSWKMQMASGSYPQLRNAKLKIVQGSKSGAQDELRYLSELYESKKNELQSKDEKIQMLENEVVKLSKNATRQIAFQEISAEARINYEALEAIGFSNVIRTDFSKMDTVSVFEVKWKKDIPRKQIDLDAKRLEEWLKLRLQNNKLQLKEVPN